MEQFNLSISSYRPFLPLKFPFLVWSTFVFIGGILTAYFTLPLLVVGSIVGGVTLFLLFKNPPLLKKFYIFTAVFLLGFGRTFYFLHYRTTLFPLHHVSLEGTVESITYNDSKPWRYQSLLKINRIFTTNKWENKPCTIQLYTTKKPQCAVADTIHCSLERINAPEGEFKLYLYKENIDATVFQPFVQTKIIHRPPYSFKRWISQKKKILHYRLLKKINSPTFALFSSLFLGNRVSIKQELELHKPLFKVWGISHFLARSGIHLLIFIILLSRLLSLIPAPFTIKHGFLLLCSFLYFLFSWPSVSFNRAFYTFLFCKVATFFTIPLHSMHVLALVCLLILFQSPLQILFLDFQLTFLLTFCLIWIANNRHQRRLLFSQKLAK
jgi:predicted membrane metal-binding protein